MSLPHCRGKSHVLSSPRPPPIIGLQSCKISCSYHHLEAWQAKKVIQVATLFSGTAGLEDSIESTWDRTSQTSQVRFNVTVLGITKKQSSARQQPMLIQNQWRSRLQKSQIFSTQDCSRCQLSMPSSTLRSSTLPQLLLAQWSLKISLISTMPASSRSFNDQ